MLSNVEHVYKIEQFSGHAFEEVKSETIYIIHKTGKMRSMQEFQEVTSNLHHEFSKFLIGKEVNLFTVSSMLAIQIQI